MDKTDKHILELLQDNGKLNNQDLAEKVALSPSPCLRRVKQLEKEGYIKSYSALLNPEKLGLKLTILVSIGLNTHEPKKMTEFENRIQAMPEVIQCFLIAGQAQDYMLTVVASSLEEYHTFLLKKLTQIEGVNNVHSSFVLRNIIEKPSLPLHHL